MASSASHPLRHAPFVWFWLGQSISLLGNRVYSVALPFLVLELGGSAAQIGRLLAVYAVPQLLFLLTGGVLVDRFPRRLTMLVSNALHALLLGVVLVLMLSGRLELSHLYVLSGLFGLLSAFFMPAAMSITPQLVPREVLTQANALRSFASELAGILGPPLGGLLITFGSLSLALGFDALTFVLGALCLLALRPRLVPRQAGGTANASGYWRDLREGFRYVAGLRWLWVTIVLFSFVNIFVAGVMSVLLPLLAASRFAGAASLGWLLSGLAGGALFSALALNRLTLQRRGWTAYLAVAAAGLGLVGVGLAPQLVLGVTAMGCVGSSLTVFGVVWETAVQTLVPEEVLGRVFSLDMLGSFALLPLGFVVTGSLAERFGASSLILIYGLVTVILALVGLLVPAVRRL